MSDKRMKKVLAILGRQKAVAAIFVMIFVMLFTKTSFFTAYNWMNMFRSMAILEIIGIGVTMPVLCAGCDLSVGGSMCLGGVVAVMMINAGLPVPVAFAGAVLSGIAVGFVNGFLVVKQKTEPFIITLGMGMLLKGICQELTDAHPVACKNLSFMKIGNGMIGPVPLLIVYMLVFLGIFYFVLKYTGYGRNCYAIGGNYEVAKNSGINALGIKWSAFVISGAVAAIAGVLLSARMNTASSVYGDSTGMIVNCGVVIGGTSFAGGIGGMIESFIGIFVLQLMSNCMDCLEIGEYCQQLLQGIIIVLIIGADCYGRKIKRERV